MDQLLQRLMAKTQAQQPAPAAATGSVGLETLLQNLLSGSLAPVRQSRPGPIRRDWNMVVCFSCGKPGHSANRCPTSLWMIPSRSCCRDGQRKRSRVVMR